MATKTAYENLKERFAELSNLGGAAGVLYKDAETFMQPGSAEDRSQQMQALASVSHRLITDPQMKQWLDEAEAASAALSPEDKRNLFLMKREWVDANALTPELARELARLESEGTELHDKYKATGDWAHMKGWYKHSFNIMSQVAQAKMAAMPGVFASPYEALLDKFSPGLKEATVAREFAKIEKALPAMIREAQKRQAAEPKPIPLQGPFPLEQTQELCRRVLEATGFDFNRGRFDLCKSHPSSGGTSDDARITGQHDDNDFLQALYGAIHEGGHATYDQNQPKQWRYQPAGSHLGMAIHETQSRIMEVQACHSLEFFQYLEREARDVFNRPNDPALAADNLYRLSNTVTPSFIRIDADEMTYPAHVILRSRLEKAIIEGNLSVDDLPQAWDKGMQDLLGITPPDNSKGCMQDVHWPTGGIGYFPAYTAPGGDSGAAQFYAAACREHPEIPSEIAKGNFKPLCDWRRDKIHAHGCLLTPEELFVAATGEPPNADYYLDHLSRRYLGKPFQPAP